MICSPKLCVKMFLQRMTESVNYDCLQSSPWLCPGRLILVSYLQKQSRSSSLSPQVEQRKQFGCQHLQIQLQCTETIVVYNTQDNCGVQRQQQCTETIVVYSTQDNFSVQSDWYGTIGFTRGPSHESSLVPLLQFLVFSMLCLLCALCSTCPCQPSLQRLPQPQVTLAGSSLSRTKPWR